MVECPVNAGIQQIKLHFLTKTPSPIFLPRQFLNSNGDQFGELDCRFTISPEVNVLINEPARTNFSEPDKPVLLIFYALPNGNTIEQTIGKTTAK